jgi:hypothetical protein
MHEYDAIRNELNTSLAAQVSIMSFGAATVGLLVAAAATLWERAGIITGALLLFVVPAACLLTLSIHATEMVRLMRAGLFLNHIENWVNKGPFCSGRQPDSGILLWEQWGIRRGPQDMARRSRQAITYTFVLLALGFMAAGYWRLRMDDALSSEWYALGTLGVALIPVVLGLRGVIRMQRYANAHRSLYEITVRGTQPYASSRTA